MALELTGILVLDNIGEKRDEWLAFKKSTIGSSEISVILGLNTYKTPQELYFEKRSGESSTKDNDAMWWGRELESVILKKFTEETTLPHKQPFAMYRDPRFEWATASPDAWLFENGEYGIGEVKTVGAHIEHEWQYAPPVDYIHQLQWQLGITGLKFGYLIGFLMGSRKLRYFRIEFDAALFEAMLKTADVFMDHLETKSPPMHHEGLTIPKESDTEVELSEEWAPLINTYLKVQKEKTAWTKQVKDADTQMKLVKADLIAAMGEAKIAKIPTAGYVIMASQTTVGPKTQAGYSYYNVKIKTQAEEIEEA